MRTLFTIFLFLLLSGSIVCQAYIEESSPIYENTLRFHVRADSAQELKRYLETKTDEIAQVAANASDGKPVRVYFTKERFPIRHYGAAIFPAGEYQALRVDIGKAQGHNWWCAFYPKLCYTPEKKFKLSKIGEKQWKKIFLPSWNFLWNGL